MESNWKEALCTTGLIARFRRLLLLFMGFNEEVAERYTPAAAY
jgi:hypothetical protein